MERADSLCADGGAAEWPRGKYGGDGIEESLVQSPRSKVEDQGRAILTLDFGPPDVGLTQGRDWSRDVRSGHFCDRGGASGNGSPPGTKNGTLLVVGIRFHIRGEKIPASRRRADCRRPGSGPDTFGNGTHGTGLVVSPGKSPEKLGRVSKHPTADPPRRIGSPGSGALRETWDGTGLIRSKVQKSNVQGRGSETRDPDFGLWTAGLWTNCAGRDSLIHRETPG